VIRVSLSNYPINGVDSINLPAKFLDRVLRSCRDPGAVKVKTPPASRRRSEVECMKAGKPVASWP
jgi:hypothetical protein